MIDSNNQFKKLSADLVAAARGIMEKKNTKLDPVGKADADIDNDGDVDASDDYLHNRRKAISKAMKKEEVENIDELSRKTLASYVDKASQSAADHGYQYGRKKAEADEVDRMMNRHMSFADKDKVRDVMKTTTKDVEAPHRKAGRRLQGITRAASRLAKEEVEQIDEALNAANRYGDHHAAIKSLLKSISQHVENHKSDALKHKDYRGKKGVHWGHVGDLAQVHSQLADIHDRLAQQGEYKKSMSESVEDLDIEQIDELSKATMASYVKKAADDFQKRKPKMGYDGQLKKMQNRKVGVNRALDKMYGEEVEDLEELSKATMAGYIKSAGKDIEHAADRRQYFQGWVNDKDPDIRATGQRRVAKHDRTIDKRLKGSSMAATKLAREEVEAEFTQEELDYLDVIAAELELDEARGRPRKNPLPAGKETDEPEPRQHIIQQLQRAKLSMHGSAPIKFRDGTTHEVHGKHAAHLLGKYSDMKPYEKEAFQKKIGQSHANLKSELN